MTLLIGNPRFVAYDAATGDPLAGGKVYSYQGGTVSTPIATYPTMPDAEAATNANANPVILDARGEADIVVNGSTKLVLKDADGNQIWAVDYLDGVDSSRVTVNGDEVISLTNNTDAINVWDVANSAATAPLIISATGDDDNIVGQLISKGSGALKLDGGSTGALELNSASTGAINLRRATTMASTLAVTGATTLTGALTANGTSTFTTALNATGTFNLIPSGSVMWFAGTAVPTGYLECDGAAVSRTTYAALYAAIGTAFGAGDAVTTFNVPNQARRSLVGRGGAGTATLGSTVGSTGGEETHTITTGEMPAHTHTYNIPASTTEGFGGGNPVRAHSSNNTSTTSSSAGSGTAINQYHPALVMMLIIKT